MRIVFLAVNDEFAGSMQKYVYDRHPEWVVGLVLSTQPIYKKTKLGGLLFLLKISGFMYLAEMVRMKIAGKILGREKSMTPQKLAKAHQVEIYYSSNINDAESLAQLAAWSPDLIISTNFSHYIGERVRHAARFGTWNLHKSLLPHYRGMAPSVCAVGSLARYSSPPWPRWPWRRWLCSDRWSRACATPRRRTCART